MRTSRTKCHHPNFQFETESTASIGIGSIGFGGILPYSILVPILIPYWRSLEGKKESSLGKAQGRP